MDLINLGYVYNTHGLDGTLIISSNTFFSELRYQKGTHIYLINPHNKEMIEVTVEKFRHYKQSDYVKFLEINNPDEANKYKGYLVEIDKNNAPIPEDYYRFDDLIGCKIVTTDNKYLGTVIKVEEFPAQITLRVKQDNGKHFFVPFIGEVFINTVDIKNKTITINYMDGLLG